ALGGERSGTCGRPAAPLRGEGRHPPRRAARPDRRLRGRRRRGRARSHGRRGRARARRPGHAPARHPGRQPDPRLLLGACRQPGAPPRRLHAASRRPQGADRGAPGREVALEDREPVHGIAILAASAGSELAQESDQLGGSVFTHYLQLGLSGLADRNEDGNVSLGEAFDYASERTVATTLGTATGPQHPTFRLDIQGRDDLILTRPGLSGLGYGQIRLDVPGWYFVRRPDGTLAAEIHSHGREMLALEPGPYEVARRDPSA